MSEAYRRLVEHLPPRSPAGARDLNADPRALRAVLDALPMANFGVALKRLLDALQALNRHSFDGAQRLDGLEVLRESASQLLASADRQIGGTSFPLPRQKAELGELALQFRGEFATGYRIARWEGALFLGYYVVYVTYLILAATQHDALHSFGSTMLGFVLPLTGVTLLVLWAQQRSRETTS